MSATLVDTFPVQHPHRRIVHKYNLSLSLLPQSIDTSSDEKSTAQLVHLASQYHGSEYNRLKFGPQGCPILYIPVSFHMPEYVKELQARQIACTEQKAWWPCASRERTTTSGPPANQPLSLGPCGSSMTDKVHLEKELSAAISTPLSGSPPLGFNTSAQSWMKTSKTHPLNISMIISTELLPLICARISPLPRTSPVMFDVPPMYQLDRITCPDKSLIMPLPPSPSCDSSDVSRVSIAKSLQMTSARLFSQSSITTAVQAAINSGLHVVSKKSLPTPILTTAYHERFSSTEIENLIPIMHSTDIKSSSKDDKQPSRVQDTLISKPSVSIDLSILSLPQISTCTDDDMSETPTASSMSKQSRSTTPALSRHPSQTTIQRCSIPSFTVNETISVPSFSCPYILHDTRSSRSSFSLGNIFLSSCPGKKVRLGGPIKGRCGVCRDLYADLKRMKDLGVACTICCLDDVELELLGVPWSEYSRTAHDVGVDVLRIPIPEGLTPLSLASLDAHMSHVIYTYTLKGLPVLVHCRGGVGRAGLIACCWMLKLGLCGWIETDLPTHGPRRCAAGGGWVNSEHGVRRDTMQLVERAIGVVRRRRSVKAVETYEQVRFLVDFVEYLREKSVMGGML